MGKRISGKQKCMVTKRHMSNAARDLGDLLVGDLNVGRFMSFSPIAGINDPH